jgi:hypothetical protein
MFKLPSIQKLLLGFVTVIKRFPLEILTSVIGSVAASILIETIDEYPFEETQVLTRILLCSILALTLFLSVSVFSERQKLSLRNSILLRVLAVGFVVLFFFLLYPIDNTTNIFRYSFLFVAFHLLVSFAPFLLTRGVSAFWEYNKQLFLRILISALYSSVLYAGLCIAIVSTNVLFDLKIHGEIYGHLFVFIAGIFNTVFFLAGVPANWSELEEQPSYPKGLKIFTQFVLIPLATIYLAILLTYEGKVILEWSLPEGIVSSLVLGYAVYGILSILLIYPIRHDEGNKWIKTFSKLFYVLLIPLILLLAVAIWTRIQEYGITESRYVIIVLSLWLTGITCYFLIDKSQNIKIIPISLCIIALLCIWGPQSASSISEKSQVSRLVSFFEKRGAFLNGKLISLSDSVKNNEAYEISSFIVERYGALALQPFITINIDSLIAPADSIEARYSRSYAHTTAIRDHLNIRYNYRDKSDRTWYEFEASQDSIAVGEYAYVQIIDYGYYLHDRNFNWDGDSLTFSVVTKDRTISFDFKKIAESIKNNSQQKKFLVLDTPDKNARLLIKRVTFSYSVDDYKLNSLDAYLLLKE